MCEKLSLWRRESTEIEVTLQKAAARAAAQQPRWTPPSPQQPSPHGGTDCGAVLQRFKSALPCQPWVQNTTKTQERYI